MTGRQKKGVHDGVACTALTTVSTDILFLVLSSLPFRQIVRSMQTSRAFRDAVHAVPDNAWLQFLVDRKRCGRMRLATAGAEDGRTPPPAQGPTAAAVSPSFRALCTRERLRAALLVHAQPTHAVSTLNRAIELVISASEASMSQCHWESLLDADIKAKLHALVFRSGDKHAIYDWWAAAIDTSDARLRCSAPFRRFARSMTRVVLQSMCASQETRRRIRDLDELVQRVDVA